MLTLFSSLASLWVYEHVVIVSIKVDGIRGNLLSSQWLNVRMWCESNIFSRWTINDCTPTDDKTKLYPCILSTENTRNMGSDQSNRLGSYGKVTHFYYTG